MNQQKEKQAAKHGHDPRMMAPSQEVESSGLANGNVSTNRSQHPEGVNGDLREAFMGFVASINTVRKAKSVVAGYGWSEFDYGYISSTADLGTALQELSNIARNESAELLDILRG